MKKLLIVTLITFGMVAIANATPILNEKTPNSGTYYDTFPVDVNGVPAYSENGLSYGWYTNSGAYLGTFQGNDKQDIDQNASSEFLNNLQATGVDVTGLTINLANNVSITTTDESDGSVIGTYATGADVTNQSRTGTWLTNPAPTTISFYTVKAGNYYSIYQLSPAQGNGSWSTYDMWKFGIENGINGIGGNGGLEISHFLGINPRVTTTNVVPEPTTMLLFGTGIVGLATVGRRRKK